MDGVSAVTAIIGLARTARGITGDIRKLLGANESLTDLHTLVTGFTNSCDAIAGVLYALPRATEQDISNRDRQFWMNFESSVTALRRSICRLGDLMRSIQDTRRSAGGRPAAAVRMRWGEREILEMRDMARDMQSHVSVMLSLLNM